MGGTGLASKDIIAQKHAQAAEKVRNLGVDLWVTYVQETSAGAERVFAYVSPGNFTWESAVLVTPEGKPTVICGRLDQQVFEESGLFKEVTTFVQDFKVPFMEYLGALKPRKVAVNFSLNDPSADGIPHGRFLQLESMLKEAAPGVEIVSAEPIIGALISQKSELELACIQEAVVHTVEILGEIHAYLKSGLTEKQIYDFVNARIASRGLTPSFETLVFAGDRGAGMGHGTATDNPLQPGDIVHVDMGVFVRGYASDMQRTWYVLKPGEVKAPEAAQKGFDVIVKAVEACRAALKPGVKGVEVDTIARGMVTAAGFPEYPHALGHQVGRHVHDGGALLGPAWARYRNTPFLPVEESQIFTLEPSLHGARLRGRGHRGGRGRDPRRRALPRPATDGTVDREIVGYQVPHCSVFAINRHRIRHLLEPGGIVGPGVRPRVGQVDKRVAAEAMMPNGRCRAPSQHVAALETGFWVAFPVGAGWKIARQIGVRPWSRRARSSQPSAVAAALQ